MPEVEFPIKSFLGKLCTDRVRPAWRLRLAYSRLAYFGKGPSALLMAPGSGAREQGPRGGHPGPTPGIPAPPSRYPWLPLAPSSGIAGPNGHLCGYAAYFFFLEFDLSLGKLVLFSSRCVSEYVER